MLTPLCLSLLDLFSFLDFEEYPSPPCDSSMTSSQGIVTNISGIPPSLAMLVTGEDAALGRCILVVMSPSLKDDLLRGRVS